MPTAPTCWPRLRRAAALPLVVLASLALAGAAAPSAQARWAAPVEPVEVVAPFALGADPFAAGQHRGADLAARPGGPVRAPCAGPVRFAGRVPRHGRAVTIVCGRLAATVLELRSLRVARGAAVGRGEVVGAARTTHVHLGARRLGDRHGYLDPLALLAPAQPPAGPAPVPAGERRRLPPPAPGPSPVPAPTPAREPSHVPAREPSPVPAAREPSPLPAPAWAGLALIAAALPLGLVRRRRTRSPGARGRSVPAAAGDSLTGPWPSTSRRRSST